MAQERLQLLLDKELGDDEAIFEDDEIREKEWQTKTKNSKIWIIQHKN